LTDKALLPSASSVSIDGWIKAVAEPEIVVYLGQDLFEAPDRETARAAITAIGPVIELADVNFPPDEVEAILAENIYHRHVIFGRTDTSRAGCDLAGLVGRVYRNGAEIISTTDPQAMTGDLVDIVRHVADLLTVFGERLRAGELIITGSIVPPVWIAGNEEIRYRLDPVDTISIKLEA
jgi:2-keto-4-pentenoate hydratase